MLYQDSGSYLFTFIRIEHVVLLRHGVFTLLKEFFMAFQMRLPISTIDRTAFFNLPRNTKAWLDEFSVHDIIKEKL